MVLLCGGGPLGQRSSSEVQRHTLFIVPSLFVATVTSKMENLFFSPPARVIMGLRYHDVGLTCISSERLFNLTFPFPRWGNRGIDRAMSLELGSGGLALTLK